MFMYYFTLFQTRCNTCLTNPNPNPNQTLYQVLQASLMSSIVARGMWSVRRDVSSSAGTDQQASAGFLTPSGRREVIYVQVSELRYIRTCHAQDVSPSFCMY